MLRAFGVALDGVRGVVRGVAAARAGLGQASRGGNQQQQQRGRQSEPGHPTLHCETFHDGVDYPWQGVGNPDPRQGQASQTARSCMHCIKGSPPSHTACDSADDNVGMQPMIELHPTPDVLSDLGLPAIPYPVQLPAFQSAVANDGALPLADMLHGLQLRAAADNADPARLEPAMARLAELLVATEAANVVPGAGEDARLALAPVDLDGPVATIQRGPSLVAAVAPHGDGRLRVSAYRPLDARTAGMLLDLATGDGWQRALDAAAGMGRRFAAIDGAARIAYWEAGIGIAADGSNVPEWRVQRTLAVRCAAHTAVELGTCRFFGLHALR